LTPKEGPPAEAKGFWSNLTHSLVIWGASKG